MIRKGIIPVEDINDMTAVVLTNGYSILHGLAQRPPVAVAFPEMQAQSSNAWRKIEVRV